MVEYFSEAKQLHFSYRCRSSAVCSPSPLLLHQLSFAQTEGHEEIIGR